MSGPRDKRDERETDDPRDERDIRLPGDPRDVRDERRQPRSMLLIAIAILLLATISASTLIYIYFQISRAPAFRFIEPFYEASPSWACPGEEIEWTAEIEVSGNIPPAISTTVRAWINPETGATLVPASLAQAPTFIWGDWPGAAQWYKENFGKEIGRAVHPYRVKRTITTTVPLNAPYDSPLMLVTSALSANSEQSRYAVPIWVKTEAECASLDKTKKRN